METDGKVRDREREGASRGRLNGCELESNPLGLRTLPFVVRALYYVPPGYPLDLAFC